MITVPIGLYFTTKSYIFEGALGMSTRDSYFYAAIVAVVAVHVVLAVFVYVAWNEGSRQWREGKQD
ncbi:Vacuolar ATPase assembly integral membrane protein VMA21 [Heterocephalus glaber]|nr:Vacuolar ATPase assembly integral membrane protein VMA21 [Heterocephalus glaber]